MKDDMFNQKGFLINEQTSSANSSSIVEPQTTSKIKEKLGIGRDFFQATMESVHEGVIVTDLNGIIHYSNPAAHKLLMRF